MDNQRIAAADQLRRYASILGVGCEILETPRAMSQALEENKNKELVLLDTPGLSSSDGETERELALLFNNHPEVDVQIVLPATMKAEDLSRASGRFRTFGATKLIFTQIDATASLGSVLNEAIRSGLALSFLCTGQEIPEDIEEATAARLIESVFPARFSGAVAAA